MVTWLIGMLVGIVTGTISGLGIGGGTVLVLFLTTVLSLSPADAAGINLVYFLGCAPASLWFHVRGGLVNRRAAWYAVLGGVGTAVLAALFAPADSPDWLRRIFGILLLTVGAREIWMFFHTEKKSG